MIDVSVSTNNEMNSDGSLFKRSCGVKIAMAATAQKFQRNSGSPLNL